MHHYDIAALLARIAGLGILATDTAFQQSITTLFGVHGTAIIAGIGLASVLATDVLRVIGSPAGTTHVVISSGPSPILPQKDVTQ